MKRLLSLSLMVAGLFGIGTNALAETLYEPTTAILASSSEFAEEQIIIFYSGDSTSNPYLQSIISILTSSYASDNPLFTIVSPKFVETKPPLQSGGTSGVGTVDNTGSGTGNGNTIKKQAQPTTSQPGPTTLRLIEIYPNTNGNDAEEEYITVANTGLEPVDLKGWSIKDASEKTKLFDNDLIVPAGSQTKLTRAQTDITLNNDADTVDLFAPDNSLIDSVKYESSKKGEVYKWIDGIWSWPTETPANEPAPVSTNQNTIITTNPITTTATSSNTTTNVTEVLEASEVLNEKEVTEAKEEKEERIVYKKSAKTTIAEAKNLPDQANVTISAVVSAWPGTLGKQFFYVQDETGGIQIYKHDAVFPELAIGQQVKIMGEMSTNGNERRIKVNKNGSIDALDQTSIIEPQKVEISELKTGQIGKLFKISGMISENLSNQLIIESSGAKLDVSISDQTGIDTSLLAPGMLVEIVGVVRPSGDGVKLSPRAQTDIVVLQNTEPVVAGTITNGKDKQNNIDQKIALALSFGTGLTFAAFVIRHMIRKQKITYATDRSVELTTENVH